MLPCSNLGKGTSISWTISQISRRGTRVFSPALRCWLGNELPQLPLHIEAGGHLRTGRIRKVDSCAAAGRDHRAEGGGDRPGFLAARLGRDVSRSVDSCAGGAAEGAWLDTGRGFGPL